MSRTILFTILNLIGFYFIFNWLFHVVYDYKKRDKSIAFFTRNRFKYIISLITLIGIPYLMFNYFPFFDSLKVNVSMDSFAYSYLFCGALALITSLIWLDYILKLDVFEKEKRAHILVVFLMGMLLTIFATQPLYGFLKSIGFDLNDKPLNDFIYCVFGIGLIEESVKLIPLLFILKFTKAVNEPYDYILYASVSALGFAFAENVMYLNRYGAEVILARTFYATIAHMTFSSTIAYGFILKKYHYFKKSNKMIYVLFFGIAIFSHGFYDFWLINPVVKDFSAFTTLFFMITIHIWFTMMNNAINISNFFSPKIVINNDMVRYQLVKNFIALISFSYIYIRLTKSLTEANFFIVETSLTYGYIIFYIVSGVTRYNVVRGFLKPFQIPFNFLIPRIKSKE